MLLRLAVCALIGIIGAGPLKGQENCRLLLKLVDLAGGPWPDCSYRVEGSDEVFETGKEQVVPCGDITIKVIRERVAITTRPGHQVRTLGSKVPPVEAHGEPTGITLIGVDNYSRFSECDRLRVTPVFQPERTVESYISHRGGAGVPLLEPGAYLLVLIGKTGICGYAVSTTNGSSPFKVELQPARLRNPWK